MRWLLILFLLAVLAFSIDMDPFSAEQIRTSGIQVTIEGEVEYPGVYTLEPYTELQDLLDLAGTKETEAVIDAMESNDIYFDGPGGRVRIRGTDHHASRRMSCFYLDRNHHVQEIFRTGAIHSDYVENMIEKEYGVSGGLKALGSNAEPIQYNMLLNKLLIKNHQ